ncbi:hypothetical protein BH11PSE3_BH11PSE3_50050 [soil metagenome]
MPSDSQQLHFAEQHIAEIDEHIAAQRALAIELRAKGEDATESEKLLHNLLESQVLAVTHRRLMLDRIHGEPQREKA